jgi:uncharacterized protein (TIGR03067 family)
MRAALATAALVLSAGAAVADDAAARRMLKDLEGSYTPTAITKGGEAAAAEELSAVSAVVIKGDAITVRFKKGDKAEDHTATLVVDPSQKPLAIDLTPKDGPEANKPVLGIAKLEGDTLTLCWSDRRDKAERPKDFSSTKENKNFLIVMKKAK